VEIRVKRVNPEAKLPTRAHVGDLGYDLYSVDAFTFDPGDTYVVHTGIEMNLPAGYGAVIKDRSSMAIKGFRVSAGVLDNGYCNEVKVVLTWNATAKESPFSKYGYISSGDKIAQLILVPVPTAEVVEVDEIVAQDTRGQAGFGSTGA
jgi:dUTP pyrophosphatase